MAGGKGTIVGTILGVLIIGTLNNGMILMQVPTFYQLVAKGLLLLGAVMLMEFRTAKRDLGPVDIRPTSAKSCIQNSRCSWEQSLL